jgi:hypothetical protein
MRLVLVCAYLCSFAPAFAYTVSRSSQGKPLHFTAPTVQASIDPDHPSDLDGASAALTGACAAWSALPESRVLLEAGEGIVKVRFYRHEWPHAANMLAVTIVQSHPDTGAIVGATVEVNQQDHVFRAGGQRETDRTFDLQGVLTHELGHALGLGHSDETAATMFARTAPGDAQQQTPDEDDRAGIAFLYDGSAADAVSGMDPTASVMPALSEVGCSVASTRSGNALGLFSILLLSLVGSVRVSRRD